MNTRLVDLFSVRDDLAWLKRTVEAETGLQPEILPTNSGNGWQIQNGRYWSSIHWQAVAARDLEGLRVALRVTGWPEIPT